MRPAMEKEIASASRRFSSVSPPGAVAAASSGDGGLGYEVMNHITMEIPKMMVPAFLR